MTIYYCWNPIPDLCHMVIEHLAKLSLSSGIDYQGISDTANISIAHSKHICSKLLLICNSIITHYILCVLAVFITMQLLGVFEPMDTSVL